MINLILLVKIKILVCFFTPPSESFPHVEPTFSQSGTTSCPPIDVPVGGGLGGAEHTAGGYSLSAPVMRGGATAARAAVTCSAVSSGGGGPSVGLSGLSGGVAITARSSGATFSARGTRTTS